LGPSILTALLAANFKVTVLTRATSTHTFPPTVTVAPVDYTSLSSLTSALQGQDAVISTIATVALSEQLLLVDAAAAAGVKRFLPSEFGSNTVIPKTSKLPVFKDKVAVQARLRELAASHPSFSYTLLITGPFLDWGLKVGFIVDIQGKKIRLYNGGERKFSTTSLPTIGKAVAAVLRKPAETKNRAVHVQDAAITQKELLAMGKKAAGAEGWTEEVVDTEEWAATGWAELKKEKPDPAKFVMPFLASACWGDESYGGEFTEEELDNELLGIKELGPKEVQKLVDQAAAK
jgi:uncharacterized protein YbjT (DUF2867 family)